MEEHKPETWFQNLKGLCSTYYPCPAIRLYSKGTETIENQMARNKNQYLGYKRIVRSPQHWKKKEKLFIVRTERISSLLSSDQGSSYHAGPSFYEQIEEK